ncbi:MAG: hypothetical protein KA403_07225 [Candidatus Omnitrophica bacterium]|nr:hypothetical protein [Candidatus Omnitrophota bacterium]
MEEQIISIIAVDKENIRESLVVKGGWVVPFKLSAKPNDSWERHFYEVHRKNTNPKKKAAKLVNDCIEVQVLETDVQQQALDMIKEDVENTNVAYKDVFLKKIQLQDDMKALQLRQQGVLQKLRDDSSNLKF